MTNYYHLSKKELSFISSEQPPVIGSNGERLTKPVVVCISKLDRCVSRIYTLKWFKFRVKKCTISLDFYEYHIKAMY